jgi:hypothetical protein
VIGAGYASLREKLRQIIERRQQQSDQLGSQGVMVDTLKARVDQPEQTLDGIPDHRERSANDRRKGI